MLKKSPEVRQIVNQVLRELDDGLLRAAREIRATLEFQANLRFSSERTELLFLSQLGDAVAQFKPLMLSREQADKVINELAARKAHWIKAAREEE